MLATLVAGIVVIVWGTKAKGWYFAELSAVFLLMGLVSGFIMGWGPNEIAEKVAKSFSEIAVACMMIGIARGILVVLQAGHIIDTIVYYLSIPLSQLPGAISAVAMFLVQTGINFFIPSDYGAPGRPDWHLQTVGRTGIPVWRRPFQYHLAYIDDANHLRYCRCQD